MVRVKICGITRAEDAIAAAEAGADAIGLVFAKSPRQVSIAQARRIVEALPPFVSAVGVFVNESPARIRRIVDAVGLSAIQLHGDESPRVVSALRPLVVIKAIRVADTGFAKAALPHAAAGAGAILLDTYSETAYGGTGKTLDWKMLRKALAPQVRKKLPPLILAGGLNPRNVAEGIRVVRPWGVDVSGGVESGPGVKAAAKISNFIAVTGGF